MKLFSSTKLARFAAAALLAAIAASFPGVASAADDAKRPVVVLVHGAMADSSTWSAVVPKLQAKGYKVIAAANPLRSLKGDSAYVSELVKSVTSPVVLVGHSYGGSVITNAAADNPNVKALVYVAAFAPDAGESAFDLVGKFPGSILGAALAPPVTLADGAHDLYVEQSRFKQPFAADLSDAQVKVMAASIRPVADVALKEPSASAAWKSIPSWFVYGSADKSIPPEAHAFMAARAHAKDTKVVKGASHLVMISHPDEVARIIEESAAAAAK